jgi:hypothetical protein
MAARSSLGKPGQRGAPMNSNNVTALVRRQ